MDPSQDSPRSDTPSPDQPSTGQPSMGQPSAHAVAKGTHLPRARQAGHEAIPTGRAGQPRLGHNRSANQGTPHAGQVRLLTSRIVSLDVARGVMLIVSVLSASLVLTPLPAAFTHAPWYGVHFLDLVFPAFVTMSGVGFAFAYKNGARPAVVLRRTLVLILLGLAYTAVATQTWDLSTLRFTGVLQLYGLLALAQGLLHWKARNWRAWVTISVLLTTGLTILHSSWPQTYCGLGGLTQTCNPSLYIDANVFGLAHMYKHGVAGHDPEGLVATAGALVSMSLGTTLGHLLLRVRHKGAGAIRDMVLWLAVVTAVGLGLAQVVEPFKRLWTPSFAILAALPALVLIVLIWLWLDRPTLARNTAPSALGRPGIAVVGMDTGEIRILPPGEIPTGTGKPTASSPSGPSVPARSGVTTGSGAAKVPLMLYPLQALGRNSLLVYFGSHLLIMLAMRGSQLDHPAWPVVMATQLPLAPWSFAMLCVLGWTLLAVILDRYTIYVRA